ncbi:MAG: nitroreductase family protein [Acidobacteriota bacterium]
MAEQSHPFDVVADLIQRRKTLKVLAEVDAPVEIPPAVAAAHRPVVLDALRIAGWAPFHYARGVDDLAEPWRAHVLWADRCRALAPQLSSWFPAMRPTNKLPKMLSACGALVLVTWLPQFYHVDERKPAQTATDEEHLAAASSMVQNLLLLLTARDMGTYWSSGGQLGSPTFFERVGIPTSERLLAAVFVEYPETLDDDRERIPGKHRDSRSEGWIREIVD